MSVSPGNYNHAMQANSQQKLSAVIANLDQKSPVLSRAYGFYWTRKDILLLTSLIQSFSDCNAVVLDPFMGSGSAALAVANLSGNRKFIGIELNELPVANLKFSLGLDLGPAEVEVGLMDSLVQEITNLYSFPTSYGHVEITKIIHDRFAEGLNAKSFQVKVAGNKYMVSFDNDAKLYTELLSVYEQRIQGFGVRPDNDLEHNSRIAVFRGMKVSGAFGPLGFEALSLIADMLTEADSTRLILAAMIHQVRLTDARSQSQFPYWQPKQDIHEKSAAVALGGELGKFKQNLDRYASSQGWGDIEEKGDHLYDNLGESFMILTGSCIDLIPNVLSVDSVDLVVTDPPYFDQVAYSEYLKLWEHFTGYGADLELEIVQSNRQNSDKTRQKYLQDIELSFRTVRTSLKDSGKVLVFFKDSKPRNLHDFISALGRAGLYYVAQVHFHKGKHTYKQNTSKESTVGGDSVILFEPDSSRAFTEPNPNPDIKRLDSVFIALMNRYLSEHGPSSLTEILDNLIIGELYHTGYLGLFQSGAHFTQLANENFNYNHHTRTWSQI